MKIDNSKNNFKPSLLEILKGWAFLFLVVGLLMFSANENAFADNCTLGQLTCGLVSYWAFDEGSGNLAHDVSGNGNTGTLKNNPLWVTGQADPYALSFNGGSYVDMGNINSFTGTSAFSVSFWFKFQALPGSGTWERFISKEGPGGNPRQGWLIFFNGNTGQICLERWQDGLNNDTCTSTASAINTNTWHHFVVTYDGSTMTSYLDGVVSSSSSSNLSIHDNTLDFNVGSLNGGSSLTGIMDDVRVYNRALVALDVQSLYFLGMTLSNSINIPVVTQSYPTATLPSWTTYSHISVEANTATTCRYSVTPNVSFFEMLNVMDAGSDGTTFSIFTGGLNAGQSVSYYVRCLDLVNGNYNLNTTDIPVTLNVAGSSGAPPDITEMDKTIINPNTVDIVWTTDRPSDSQVNYGLNVGYGSQTDYDPSLSYGHAAMLQNLLPNTTYHYQIVSKDSAGNAVTSADQTFKTFNTITPYNYYVATNGNDSNLGTIDAPFLTIEHARSVIRSIKPVSIIGAASWVPGIDGNTGTSALSFDGTDNYIPAAANFGGNQWTVSFWVNPTFPLPQGSPNWGTAALLSGDTSNQGLYLSGGGLSYSYMSGSTLMWPTISSYSFSLNSGPITTNPGWHHVVIEFDGSNLIAYIDGGIKQANGTYTYNSKIAVPANANPLALSIPRNIGMISGNSHPFKGSMQEIRFYNSVLTSQDVQNLLARQNVPTNMVLYYPLSEGSGNIVYNHIDGGITVNGGVTVFIRGGVYQLSSPLVLTAADSGFDGAPIIYQGYPNEVVRISAGQIVNGATLVDSSSPVWGRLNSAAQGNLMQINLSAQGITDYGQMVPRGDVASSKAQTVNLLEPFFNGQQMQIARWPNATPPNMGSDVPIKSIIGGGFSGTFTYAGNRSLNWAYLDDLWVNGMWMQTWTQTHEKVNSITVDNSDPSAPLTTITTGEASIYANTAGQPFYFENILEELDGPNQWYLDRNSAHPDYGILYFWPPTNGGSSEISVSMLPNIMTSDASYVIFENLIFENSRNVGIKLSALADHSEFLNSTIRNTGDVGITILGVNSGLFGCKVYGIGGNVGVSLSSGNRFTLSSGFDFIENTEIYNMSRWNDISKMIMVAGVGQRLRFNHLHDSTYDAIAYGGNNHIIDFNEIDHVVNHANDGGAIYTNSQWVGRGTIERYNYIHDLEGYKNLGAVGVYIDDLQDGITAYGNVLSNIGNLSGGKGYGGAGFQINDGRDNIVDNNICVQCQTSVWITDAGYSFDSLYIPVPLVGATNTTPITISYSNLYAGGTWRITSQTPSLQVTISGVQGNTAANGTWNVSVVDSTHLTLTNSSGNAPYTGGGTVILANYPYVSGLYTYNYLQPPYSVFYPTLSLRLTEGDPAQPRGTTVVNNIFNQNGIGQWSKFASDISEYVYQNNNLFDANLDSSFQPLSSPTGFKAIPFSKIGLLPAQNNDLTVTTSGTGTGVITSDPSGINCPNTCVASFSPGASVTLTATVTNGAIFNGWSGPCSGTGTCTVSMSAAQYVSASFTAANYTLNVCASASSNCPNVGTGFGAVIACDPNANSNCPSGLTCSNGQCALIECGVDNATLCSATVSGGTSITLQAVPAENSVFTGWSGGGCSGTGACTVTMDASTSVSASFAPETFAITSSSGSGGTISPLGSVNVSYGSNQVFTLTPQAGYTAQLTVDGSNVTLSNNTYTLSNVTAAHTVVASFILNTETIATSAGSNGSISPSGNVGVNYGANQTFSVTPSVGYVASLTVDGNAVVMSNNSYTLSNVTVNHSIAVSFSLKAETITASAGSNGSISPSGNVTVNYGANQTFSVTPSTGYTASLTVDGNAVALSNNSYTLNNVTVGHSIAVTFTLQTETITASAGSHGSISPSGNVAVNYGANQTFTVTPSTGYTASLTVDGNAVALSNNSYTMSNVTANHTIAASFALQTETITASADSHGSISPSGNVAVNYGANQTFSVAPSTGYTASLIVDGNVVALSNNTYTLSNVTASHSIAVIFSLETETITASAGSNGSVSPTSATINYGSSQTFTVTPNLGYTASLTVDGNTVALSNNSYTLSNVTANHTIAVSFTQETETIAASAGSNGSISPTSATVTYGSNQIFTITPNQGYVASLTVDGNAVAMSNNSYVLNNVTTNHTVAATFTQETESITTSAGINGSISPTSATVLYGGSQIFAVVPNVGYAANLTVDGNAVAMSNKSYTLSNVIASHSIAVTFSQDIETITASAGSNGNISPTNATVTYGGSQTFNVTPNDGYTASLIVDGNAVAMNNNSYTLTNVTANHTIAVSFSQNTETITTTAGSHGSIAPTNATVFYGGNQTFTLTPSVGYAASLTVDGNAVAISNNSYTLRNVTANHVIAVSFTQETENITTSAGSHGSISPTTSTVIYGSNQTFTVTPDLGYAATLTVDGNPVALSNNSYNLNSITVNHAIAVTFTQETETIATSAGSNGSISPSGNVSINYGGNQTFSVTPSTGYTASLIVDGNAVAMTNNSYTLSNVTVNHSIAVSFSRETESITASAGSNGSINPTSATVLYGDNQIFTITPNLGYTANLTVDGNAVAMTNNSYTLNNVIANHNIAVSFTQETETLTASAGSHGSISPSGNVGVTYGANQTFSVTPDLGYTSILIIDGNPVAMNNNTYTLSNVIANHSVSVSFSLETETISASAGSNGSISPSGNVSVNYGANQTFSVIPSVGYSANLNVDGNVVAMSNNSYTLSNVTASHSIAVSFSRVTETITASTTGSSNGSISPASATVFYGGSQTFIVTPSAGYSASLTVDGNPVAMSNNSYTLSNVTASHIVAVSFGQGVETITVTAGSNGSISPSGNLSVNYGGNQTFSVTPNVGYVASLTLDGNVVAISNNSYTLINVTVNHTIAVTFAPETETVAVSAGSNGTVSPSGNVAVNYAESQTFIVTPNPGYIASLIVDGNNVVMKNNSYTLSNVTADHTVAVSFAQQIETITANAGSNGSISPTSAMVAYGSSQTFWVTPNDGYTASLNVDGNVVDMSNNSYTLSNVTANHILAVSFTQETGTINTSVVSNAVAVPSRYAVSYSGSQSLTVNNDSSNSTIISASPSSSHNVVTIVSQPVNQTVKIGQEVTFSVGTSSSNTPLTYQWQKDGDDIPGATSASYTIPATTDDDDGSNYTVKVSTDTGDTISDEALLTVGKSAY